MSYRSAQPKSAPKYGLSSRVRAACLLVGLSIVALAFFAPVRAQQAPDSPPVVIATPQPTSLQTAPAFDLAQQLELAALREAITLLETRIETSQQVTNIALAALSVFLVVFGTLGVLGSVFAERRTREAHSLSIRGEAQSQARSQESHQAFLSGSKDTLELVNQTLTLAKEASERAASVIERKAKATLNNLDISAKELLLPTRDDRALIATPHARSLLNSLAQRIAGFEISSFMFPEELGLTPPCLFIRGMSHHLAQQFDDAMDYWRQVALSSESSSSLKSQAWYWIGYEQNNLGRFDNAQKSFHSALQDVSDPRRFELSRIMIEARFFDKDRFRPSELVSPLSDLLSEIGSESQTEEHLDRATKIRVTLGNVLLASYREEGEDKALLTRALEMYAEAKKFDKWAILGWAETKHLLGQTGEVADLYKDKIRASAIDEYIRRTEPRTKVLARTTELICCLRVKSLNDEAPGVYGDLVSALGQVDERLTIYSQFEKRNVTKEAFLKELDRELKKI